MPQYRLDFLASLARQMAFTPAAVREQQVTSAEDLLLSIDPAKAYPPPYVVFKITGYHPPTPASDVPAADLATGLALQHDLGLLVEQVSLTLDARTADRAEPVLRIDDLVAQFNVTSKTIQRWRRRGLAARRFVFPDGKRRVGFRLSVVERYVTAHAPETARPAAAVVDSDWPAIDRHLLRLAADRRRPSDELCARAARRFGRTALSVEAELAKRAAETGQADYRTGRAATVPGPLRAEVLRLAGDGLPLAAVSRRTGLPRSTAYRVLLAERLRRTVERRVKFFDDPLYHDADADAMLDAMAAQRPLPAPPAATPADRPARLPSDLAGLCDHRVLPAAEERALFLQYNFRKYQAVVARRRLDPAKARLRQLKTLDRLLARATDVRNTILRSNLRLVVAVARQHVRPGLPLAELVSEGSLVLLRAVESFDTRRGNKFSTYATLALAKGFARAVGRSRAGQGLTGVSLDLFRSPAAGPAERVERADRMGRLLAGLDADERGVIADRYGVGDTPGIADAVLARDSRRLERSALGKLRALADAE